MKRMGRLGRSESRLSSFGIRGKQFRYIEGKLPEGFHFHNKMTDHDVRNLQAQGAEVIVLESNFTSGDLEKARAGCGNEGKTLNQKEAKALPGPARGSITSTPAPQPIALTSKAAAPKESAPEKPAPKASPTKADDSASSADTTDAALLDVSSTPTEADIYVDERLSGRTPSTLILMPGDHTIVIKKNGFVIWQRKFKLSSGPSSVDAELVPKAK